MTTATRLILRTSDKDGKTHGGFQWPKSGPVEFKDWNPAAVCGGGGHGILWPEGDWSDIKEYEESLWQVVEVEESTLVKIGGKVKFPRGNVIYSGSMAVAFNMVAKAWLATIPASYANVDGKDPLTTDKRNARIGSSGDSARIGSSGDYARIGSSGHSARIGSSGDSARIGSSGHSARIGSSGDYAQIGSSGDYAQIGSSGDSAQIGSSSDSARIGSSGHSAQIGSSGDYARIGSSGHYARIGSSGHSARIDSTAKDAVIACAGSVSSFRAGAGGCISAPWYDGKRTRFAIGYVGENIDADTWYKVSDKGEFVKVAP